MKPAHAMAARPYDVIVIGAGPTGENLAHRAVKAGLGAVVVERELVGGECSYWACLPSKALLRPLQALAEARAVAGARASCAGTLDVPAILARRDGFAAHWNDARQAKWLEESGIDLVRGHGRVAGERRVTVTDQGGAAVDLTARHAVAVCTGSRAAIPPIPGLAEARPWTSREATSGKRAPRRLAILGGGVVGCEMATAWRQLGTEELTIIQRGPRLIPGYEAFACEMLRDALEGLGVRVLTGTTAQRVERDAGGVRLLLASGETIAADEVLVAAGRAPRTDDVGLESVGLEPGSWLEVDDSMRVTAVARGWLYAAGDVNHRALLTHMGKYQARACGDAIVARAGGRLENGSLAPWTPYAASADHGAVPQSSSPSPRSPRSG